MVKVDKSKQSLTNFIKLNLTAGDHLAQCVAKIDPAWTYRWNVKLSNRNQAADRNMVINAAVKGFSSVVIWDRFNPFYEALRQLLNKKMYDVKFSENIISALVEKSNKIKIIIAQSNIDY